MGGTILRSFTKSMTGESARLILSNIRAVYGVIRSSGRTLSRIHIDLARFPHSRIIECSTFVCSSLGASICVSAPAGTVHICTVVGIVWTSGDTQATGRTDNTRFSYLHRLHYMGLEYKCT